MTPESAPKVGCNCDVCRWARGKIEREEDLAANYQRFLDGELVSKDDRE